MAMRGGCVLQGCLTVLGGILVLIVGGMVWLSTAPGREEDKARAHMRTSVDEAKGRLARAAADGTLLDTEIDRSVRATGPGGRAGADIRRQGRRVTVTAQFMGLGPGFMAATEVTGCYRFEIVPPSVTVREISGKTCREFPPPYRDASAVAADVVAELRTVLSQGGLTAVQEAEVWRTGGIHIQGRETTNGQLITLARLVTRTSAQGGDCYEFRAKEKPLAVTAKKLKPDGCYRIQREQEAQAEADRRAQLDAGALKIEQRIDGALGDGTLTDTELKRALALPRTDSMGQPAPNDPVAVPVSTERSSSEVVVAKVSALDQTVWNDGCYEFRAHLATRSVTRRAAGTDCLSKFNQGQ